MSIDHDKMRNSFRTHIFYDSSSQSLEMGWICVKLITGCTVLEMTVANFIDGKNSRRRRKNF